MPGSEFGPPFAVTRLTLTDFRNYTGLRLEAKPGLIVLVGMNGAGKTNLLEAISLLSPGRGLRGAEAAQLGRKSGEGSWAVSARLNGPGGEIQIGTAWSPGETEGPAAPRAVLINGKLQRSSAALAEHIRVVWLTPAQDRLFVGPAGERRRYLDRMVALFDVAHAARVAGFEKLMRERNILLQDGAVDATWLSSIESQMAELAIAIAAARLHAIHRLNAELSGEKLPAPFPWGSLAIEGTVEELVAALPALSAEDSYCRQLYTNRPLDRAAGRTLMGPHRSDFTMQHGPKQISAAEGSTGEQKALLIGLLLAQARAIREVVGAAPIVLLDEVSAHLDKTRKSALFGLLQEMRLQAWMTGTEVQVFDGVGASTVVYQVDQGSLRESKI